MKRYADDYKVVITEDEKGREKKATVYQGEFFEINQDAQGLVKFKRHCFLLLGLSAALHVAGGFVGNPGMYAFYVALPYVFFFLPLYFMTVATWRLPTKKRQYRRDEIGLSFDRIKKNSLLLLILVGVGFLGEVIFLMFFAKGFTVLEWIYLALEALTGGSAYGLFRLQKSIQITPVKQDLE